MEPDLVIRRGSKVVLVGDVTYSLAGDGFAQSHDYVSLLASATAMGLPTGLLVHCRSGRGGDSDLVIRNAGTRILGRAIRLDGTYAAATRSLDALADLVVEVADTIDGVGLPRRKHA